MKTAAQPQFSSPPFHIFRPAQFPRQLLPETPPIGRSLLQRPEMHGVQRNSRNGQESVETNRSFPDFGDDDDEQRRRRQRRRYDVAGWKRLHVNGRK